jgi:hypothetical protein
MIILMFYSQNTKTESLISPRIGDLCAVRDKDGQYYRALVKAVLSSKQVSSITTLTVNGSQGALNRGGANEGGERLDKRNSHSLILDGLPLVQSNFSLSTSLKYPWKNGAMMAEGRAFFPFSRILTPNDLPASNKLLDFRVFVYVSLRFPPLHFPYLSSFWSTLHAYHTVFK